MVPNGGNVCIGTTAPIGNGGQLSLQGNNGVGGTGYHGFMAIYNTYGSATNPKQYWRLNGAGGYEIVNSGYTSALFTFTQGGDFIATGNMTAYSSDRRLKKNVAPIENSLAKLQKIGGYTFDWDMELCGKYDFTPSNEHEHGVIAQEILEVVPDAVTKAPFDQKVDGTGSKSGEDYLTVKYEKLVPLLIQAIKDQQKLIEEMNERIATLESKGK